MCVQCNDSEDTVKEIYVHSVFEDKPKENDTNPMLRSEVNDVQPNSHKVIRSLYSMVNVVFQPCLLSV